MQLMMEQIVLSNKNRFGRSSEKLAVPEQIRFMEVDGQIVFFNEAEATCDLNAPEPDDLEFREPKKNFRIAGCWGIADVSSMKHWKSFRKIYGFISDYEPDSGNLSGRRKAV